MRLCYASAIRKLPPICQSLKARVPRGVLAASASQPWDTTRRRRSHGVASKRSRIACCCGSSLWLRGCTRTKGGDASGSASAALGVRHLLMCEGRCRHR